MADPLGTRWDLTFGNSTPYTDDPGDYDPTMPSAAYFLPQRDSAGTAGVTATVGGYAARSRTGR